MKNIILALLLFGSNHTVSSTAGNNKFSINIWDYDFSMAYTIFYSLSNDSLTIKYIGGLVGEKDNIVVQRPLQELEQKSLTNFFSSVNIDTLKPMYTNPLVSDGDQKQVSIMLNNRPVKTITIANLRPAGLDYLFTIVNRIAAAGPFAIKRL